MGIRAPRKGTLAQRQPTAQRLGPLSACAALLLIGCGGDPVGDDASVPDASVPDAGLVAPPQIPWLADGVPPIGLTPCPPGWREVPPEGAGGVTTCDPYPEGGAADCEPDEAHFPGEPGCTRIGTACPDDGWPTDLPTGQPVLYVRAGAPAGGDGTSPGSAIGNIQEAVWTASSGTIIAIAVGVYDEAVSPSAGVTLWGACVSGTRLTSSVPSSGSGVITVSFRDVEVRNLTIGDSARPGVWVLSSVASLKLNNVVVDAVQGAGVAGQYGGSITLTGTAIRNTRAIADGNLGIGLLVRDGVEADVARAVFEHNRTFGLIARDAGTILRLADVVVRDTLERNSDREFGRGLEAQAGAHVEIDRALFEHNRDVGLVTTNEGTLLRLTDVVVRDTLSRESDGTYGRGLVVQAGAEADVTRALFERNREVGILADQQGTLLRLTDAVVRDTLAQESSGVFGWGLQLARSAQAEVTRATFERNREHGMFINDEGTALQLTDVVIRDTLAQESTGLLGGGLEVARGGRVEVRRALFERNRKIGIFAWDDTTALQLMDVVVRDTLGREADGMLGAGLWVQGRAHAEGQRILLEGNRFVGAGVVGGASLLLNDTEIRNTRRADCAETTCPEAAGGFGLSAYFLAASARMTRFVVSNSALCGVVVGHYRNYPGASGGEMDLADGVISGAPVGACVQVDGYDSSRLRRNVQYVDVGVPLQATSYELPGAIDEP